MKDAFKREISYLRISVTQRCNYRCRYCMPAEGVEKQRHSDMCTFEELRDMAAAAVRCGVKKIRVTGGEPLVRRGIVDFCRMLSSLDGVEELCLTTNGALLREYALPLREAGVDRLNVSLDTLRPDRFRALTRGGELSDTLGGIRAAAEAGFSDLKLNCVLIGGVNDDEIADLVALTREHAWQVRFIELMPIGECAHWERERFLPDETVLRRCPELQKVADEGVARIYRLPDAPGTVGLIEPMSCRFCDRCSRIRITADGKLKPCLHSDAELSLRGLRASELDAAIRRGILEKPARHFLEGGAPSASERDMNEIGG